MDIYEDGFSEWLDVASEFHSGYAHNDDERAKALKAIPEPEEVIFAGYEYEDYSGNAEVFYRNGDKYYWVSGGHCSCYGLEGQWDPIEYDLTTLISALEQSTWWARDDWRNHVLERLKSRV